MYQSESQNVKDRWACELPEGYLAKMKWRNYKIPNNEKECKVFQFAIELNVNKKNVVKGIFISRDKKYFCGS